MSDDIQKKIEEIEAEMARTQKNKATVCKNVHEKRRSPPGTWLTFSWFPKNYHIGTLKAKLAKLRSELTNVSEII